MCPVCRGLMKWNQKGEFACVVCGYTEPKKQKTNGDVIRSMNNYDLADWIAKILIYHEKVSLNEYHVDCDKRCPLYKCCNDQPTDNIEGWLDLPAEVTE